MRAERFPREAHYGGPSGAIAPAKPLTQVVTIGGLFVFFPGNLIVFVPIIILPDFSDIIIDISFLHPFDPGFQLLSGDKAVSITVNSIDNLSAVETTKNEKTTLTRRLSRLV